MPCVDCGGWWQCSEVEPGCDHFAAPIDIQEHSLVIQTKEANGKCMMQVKHRSDSAPSGAEDNGWDDAGAVRFRFLLHRADNDTCVVNVEPLDPE